MGRILFVCGNYDPYPSANGVCVLRLQEALLERGIASDVVCSSSDNGVTTSKYGDVYHLQIPVIKSGFIRKIVRLFIWPLKDPRLVSTYKRTIKQAMNEHDYSLLIGVLRPIEGLLACESLGDYAIYECDSITNNGENEAGLKRILRNRVDNIEKRIYDKAKRIFHMACHSAYYSQSKYSIWRGKSEIIDIPQLVDEGIVDHSSDHQDEIKILYSGTLSRDTRSPAYAITLIKELTQITDTRITVDFYSRGNCETMIKEAETVSGGVIKQRGYVTLQQLNEAVGNTDLLLSIGNCLSGTVTSLPSKVISYMAYGKPIIHIDGGSNDIAKSYLEKYPLAIIVDPNKDLTENVNKLDKFIKASFGKRVEIETLKKQFQLNTPEYTALRIIEMM